MKSQLMLIAVSAILAIASVGLLVSVGEPKSRAVKDVVPTSIGTQSAHSIPPPRLVSRGLEQSRGFALAPILRGTLPSVDKAKQLIKTLRDTGVANDALADTGRKMAEVLKLTDTVDEWECFSAGCYFRISSGVSDTALHSALVEAREKTDGSNLMVLTSDPVPYKLALIVPNQQKESL